MLNSPPHSPNLIEYMCNGDEVNGCTLLGRIIRLISRGAYALALSVKQKACGFLKHPESMQCILSYCINQSRLKTTFQTQVLYSVTAQPGAANYLLFILYFAI